MKKKGLKELLKMNADEEELMRYVKILAIRPCHDIITFPGLRGRRC